MFYWSHSQNLSNKLGFCSLEIAFPLTESDIWINVSANMLYLFYHWITAAVTAVGQCSGQSVSALFFIEKQVQKPESRNPCRLSARSTELANIWVAISTNIKHINWGIGRKYYLIWVLYNRRVVNNDLIDC